MIGGKSAASLCLPRRAAVRRQRLPVGLLSRFAQLSDLKLTLGQSVCEVTLVPPPHANEVTAVAPFPVEEAERGGGLRRCEATSPMSAGTHAPTAFSRFPGYFHTTTTSDPLDVVAVHRRRRSSQHQEM